MDPMWPAMLTNTIADLRAAANSSATLIESRRSFLRSVGTLLLALGQPAILRAATDVPVADAHSHTGMFNSQLLGPSLKAQMEEAGVMLLSWNVVADGRWTVNNSYGIQQRSVPESGAQAAYFRERLGMMQRDLAAGGLDCVRNAADIDAARAGVPHVVVAAEGAGFVEDGLETLAKAYGDGLRQLGLVHYIRNAVGDVQTAEPEHGGLTKLGVEVIALCNRLGILVDLAHSTNASVDRALATSRVPMIWSHGGITPTQYSWRRTGNLSRLLDIEHARKIAQCGGAVGLWANSSTVGGDAEGYAREIMHMASELGPEHVMFGTDMDGLQGRAALKRLLDLRRVAELLREYGADEVTVRAIAFENYARCLGSAMQARGAS